MLEARGCWVPPPSPPAAEVASSAMNAGDSAMATRPTDTHTLPNTSIQNSPKLSARNPAGACRTPDAPLKTDRSSPTCAKDRFMSSLMKGSSGTSSAKNRSLQTCIAEPKTSVRRERGALVMNESIAFFVFRHKIRSELV